MAEKVEIPPIVLDMMARQRMTKGEHWERKFEDGAESASQKFQNLVDGCLRDGYLTKAEATMLIQEHGQLQEASRRHLEKLLLDHGHNALSLYTRSLPVPPMPEPDIRETVGQPLTGPIDEVAGALAVVGKVVTNPGKKTKFAFIVGSAAFTCLLRLLGVI